MLYYLAALIWIYLISLYAYRLPAMAAIPASLPIVIFSAMRGESGKDTVLYIERFFSATAFTDDFTLDSEPIISLLIAFSKLLFGDDVRGFFALHAFALFIGYFFIAKKRRLNKVYILTVGPVFLLDGITNGMRITLAYHALLLGYSYGRRTLTQLGFWLLALLAHITSVVTIFLALMLQKPKRTIAGLIIVIVTLYNLTMGGAIDFVALAPRIFSKLDKYSELTLPTWYSGLVDILTILALLFIVTSNSKISIWEKFFSMISAVIFCALLYYGVQQSLAVIRISKLAIIAIFTSHLLTQGRIQKYTWIIPMIGFLYSANFIRQVASDPGFLPYGQ